MPDTFRVPRPIKDEQAYALKVSAAAGEPSRWLSTTDVLQAFGIFASLAGVIAGIIACFLHYPADCDAGGPITSNDGGCYTHAYAAAGVGIIAMSVALLIVVLMVGRLSRTMPALVVATAAHQYLDGATHKVQPSTTDEEPGTKDASAADNTNGP